MVLVIPDSDTICKQSLTWHWARFSFCISNFCTYTEHVGRKLFKQGTPWAKGHHSFSHSPAALSYLQNYQMSPRVWLGKL